MKCKGTGQAAVKCANGIGFRCPVCWAHAIPHRNGSVRSHNPLPPNQQDTLTALVRATLGDREFKPCAFARLRFVCRLRDLDHFDSFSRQYGQSFPFGVLRTK